METRVPAVVAVIVAEQPGDWFRETLASFSAQDYPDLSILVLDVADNDDVTDLVASACPGAFVRRIDQNLGFAATANEAADMVEGASFLLLCHDDVVLDHDVIHQLVEESFRSNAGVVSPKFVRYDDPNVLLHIGRNCDKAGTMVDRIQPGEIDHGQHDGVLDTFVAPGGCTLVRADLFRELGGLDPMMLALGEDLDFSWRARVAGARVVVAANARVRHRELMIGGERPAPPDGADHPSMRMYQRRHELRTVLKCYSGFHLLRVLPQVVILGLGEILIALVVRDLDRAHAILHAWRWNLAHLADLRRRRSALQHQRVHSDSEVRRLQLHGSARLSTYVSRLIYQGADVAHGRAPSRGDADGEGPILTGSLGGAFSEDSDFDELDDLGHRSEQRRKRRAVLSSRPERVAVWTVVVVLGLIGARHLLNGPLPLVGQLTAPGSWSSLWASFAAGWHSPGVGSTAHASPAFAILGLASTILFGSSALAQKVLVLGAFPLGALGLSRLVRPWCSPRARLGAALAYVAMPLAYDDVAFGRIDALVAFALTPWLVARIMRAGQVAVVVDEESGPLRFRRPDARLRELVASGTLAAVAIAFAPSMLVMLLVVVAAIAVGSVLARDAGPARAMVRHGLVMIAVALLLCAPWLFDVVTSGHFASAIFGTPNSAHSVGFESLLRFDVGPVGASPLAWLLIAAATLPLVIGRAERFVAASRLWCIAVASWALALAVARGWLGPIAPQIDVVLAPAAVAIAAGIGLGVASFETDLGEYRFGWRQIVAAAAVAASIFGLAPAVTNVADGRFGLPSIGYDQALSWLTPSAAPGGYRVLWLGNANALPMASWTLGSSMAYATSENGLPNLSDVWAPSSPGSAVALGNAIELAMAGRTDQVGMLLAQDAVRYVVVSFGVAPSIPGQQRAISYPVPPTLVSSLDQQVDLDQVSARGGYAVFQNADWVPERAVITPVPTPADVPVSDTFSPALSGGGTTPSFSGVVPGGRFELSSAPGDQWNLLEGGHVVRALIRGTDRDEWRIPAGVVSVDFSSPFGQEVAVIVDILVWVAAAVILFGRRRVRRRVPAHLAHHGAKELS